jgi:hypothetical protein
MDGGPVTPTVMPNERVVDRLTVRNRRLEYNQPA